MKTDKLMRDDIVADLNEIVVDSRAKKTPHKGGGETVVLDKDLLMQKLASYVSRRDAKLWNHAFKLGEAKHDKNT